MNSPQKYNHHLFIYIFIIQIKITLNFILNLIFKVEKYIQWIYNNIVEHIL